MLRRRTDDQCWHGAHVELLDHGCLGVVGEHPHYGSDPVAHIGGRGLLICVGVEDDDDVTQTFDRGALHGVDVADRGHCILDRLDDQPFDLLSAGSRVDGADGHDGDLGVREELLRQLEPREDAQEAEGYEHHSHSDRTLDRCKGEPHTDLLHTSVARAISSPW